jgi:uncharacterized membrane protein YraQ (UPF0718 family)
MPAFFLFVFMIDIKAMIVVTKKLKAAKIIPRKAAGSL